MVMHIITADERMAMPSVPKLVILGPSGVGKTMLAKTLPAASTLVVDNDGGTLALEGWGGDVIDVRAEAAKIPGVHPWEFMRALVCLLAGPDPAASEGNPNLAPYTQARFDQYRGVIGEPTIFDKYQHIFIDSITVTSRHCFGWSLMQPDAFNKEGKRDNRGAYGKLGQEMVTLLSQAKAIPNKTVTTVGILDADLDEFKRPVFQAQIEGGKTGKEMDGIFDQIVTMGLFNVDANGAATMDFRTGVHRGFVCHKNNGFGVPAKDRSGRLNLIEPPDLGALIAKIGAGPRTDTAVRTLPQAPTQPQQ